MPLWEEIDGNGQAYRYQGDGVNCIVCAEEVEKGWRIQDFMLDGGDWIGVCADCRGEALWRLMEPLRSEKPDLTEIQEELRHIRSGIERTASNIRDEMRMRVGEITNRLSRLEVEHGKR